MNKLKMESCDVVGGNVAKIAALFPQCVTERKNTEGKVERAIDFEKLKAELSDDVIEGGEERYQFTWPDKRAAARLANTPTTMTLRPCREQSVGRDGTPGGFDSENLYIEGDNLDVLKVLRETYLGKIKMIYIDPPYNTGNDFVYNDNFVQDYADYRRDAINSARDEDGNLTRDPMVRNTEANGRFHTDWLNMIYPRLKVARDFLAEDGVVFISIDDTEYYNILKVCNEIFGEQNYLFSFSWVNSLKDELTQETKFAGSNLGKIKRSHEYVLVYAKSAFKINLDFSSNPHIIKLITNGGNAVQTLNIPKGIKCVKPIDKTFFGRIGGKSDYFDILTNEGMVVKGGVLQNDVVIEGPLRNPQMLKRFFSGEKVIDNKGQELIDVFIGETGMINTKKLRVGNTISTVLVGKGTTKNGTLLLKELFGETVFDYAKPIELLNYLISKSVEDEFIILDFFSGSATTGHSVFLSNLEPDKHVKFILVQIPEVIDPARCTNPASKKIAQSAINYLNRKGLSHTITELAKERLRLASQKVKSDNELTASIIDLGFRVLKLDTSNMEDVYYTPDKFDPSMLDGLVDNIKADRTNEDLLFQVMLSLGIELSAKIKRQEIAGKEVWNVDDGYLLACFDKDVNETTIEEMAKLQPTHLVIRDASAANDNVLDNFDQIIETYSAEKKITTHVV